MIYWGKEGGAREYAEYRHRSETGPKVILENLDICGHGLWCAGAHECI